LLLATRADALCGARRDFNEADYEALLELDREAAELRPRLSDAELRTLRTHVHGKGACGRSFESCCKPGQDMSSAQKVSLTP
jgi:hypothetical protein